jgi:hypothetical protein
MPCTVVYAEIHLLCNGKDCETNACATIFSTSTPGKTIITDKIIRDTVKRKGWTYISYDEVYCRRCMVKHA